MMRWSPAAPARPGCPHNRLARLLAAALPDNIGVGASTLRPWASANFVGARHIFPCRGAMPSGLQDHLSALEWQLPGHIVADLAVERVGDVCDFRIEILTVEE